MTLHLERINWFLLALGLLSNESPRTAPNRKELTIATTLLAAMMLAFSLMYWHAIE